MMKLKYLASAALISMIFSQTAHAQVFQGADESTRANCQQYRDNITHAKEEELKKYIPKPANEAFSTGTCLDAIMNTRINIFTMGSLDGILDRLMGMASNRACSAVMGSWNQAVGTANGTLGTNVNVPYLGTVGGTSVGTGFGGGPITVNNQAATINGINGQVETTQKKSQSALDTAATKIKNIFK